ncbi:N-acetyltransferase [Skeletonema marinoi]|uniref:N-alpha-acetyltransferase 60 n=1 Tax=Skeletonema marinoi TaxID=267567 RepID=A0AAD8YMW3_9STRA|nr:N-acetyltransferase [Skeletonema marinoi]
MWLFSPPTATGGTNNARSNAPSKADEETCCTGETSTSSMEGSEESVHENTSQHKGSAKRRRKLGRGIIYFRPIKPEDRSVIQTLHQQWFPVDYKPDFFDSLCNDRIMPGTNQPLYSCVACFKELDDLEFEEMYEKRERESCSMSLFWQKEKYPSTSRYYCNETNQECILWEGNSDEEDDDSDSTQSDNPNSTINAGASHDCCVSTDNNDACRAASLHQQNEREKMKRFYSNGFRFDDNQNSTFKNETSDKEQKEDKDVFTKQSNKDDNCIFVNDCGEIIAGCVVGSFLSSSMFNVKTGARDETATLLVPDSDEHPEMFYIMTLGTSRGFRRVGLGSILVNRVVDMIKSKQECGTLYLHVIIYNETAIKLYERLGFSRVKKIRGYYTINSVNYDCYLYARYFHGNLGHNNSDYLSNFARLMLSKMSGGLIAG